MYRKWEGFRIHQRYFRLKITAEDRRRRERENFNIPKWDDIDWYEWLVSVIKWPAYRWILIERISKWLLLLVVVSLLQIRSTYTYEWMSSLLCYLHTISLFLPDGYQLEVHLSLFLSLVRTIINRIDRDEECLSKHLIEERWGEKKKEGERERNVNERISFGLCIACSPS